jgi:hypothetical protein
MSGRYARPGGDPRIPPRGDGFDHAVHEGRRMEPDQAAELALAGSGGRLRLAT